MISDPHDPEFRYPQVGESYYHVHWQSQCTVIPAWPELLPSLPRDEVPVRFGVRRIAVVKLRSLEPIE